jgi:hypothetical protein
MSEFQKLSNFWNFHDLPVFEILKPHCLSNSKTMYISAHKNSCAESIISVLSYSCLLGKGIFVNFILPSDDGSATVEFG